MSWQYLSNPNDQWSETMIIRTAEEDVLISHIWLDPQSELVTGEVTEEGETVFRCIRKDVELAKAEIEKYLAGEAFGWLH